MERLKIEWDLVKDRVGKEIVSIYFGGGTPSLLEKDLECILGWIDKDSSCEITLEANPESLTQDSLNAFWQMGINRLSLGIQSFDDELLQLLKRRHSAKKAKQTIEWAHLAGFTNLSIDLMYDIPKQTMESWEKTLLIVKDLPITHLSLYNLTFEPNTFFHRKKSSFLPLLPNETLSLQLLQRAISSFTSSSLERYEISAFAKNGYYSRHNVGYWIGRPFLGLGPSAFSYEGGRRFQNSANLQQYYQLLNRGQAATVFAETLPFDQKLTELFLMELRLIQGVQMELFQEKHGKIPKEMEEQLKKLTCEGWLEKKQEALCLSKKGLLFYDSVAESLL